jgi:hypothetical protein
VTVFTLINTRGMMKSFDSSIINVRRNVFGKINKIDVLNLGNIKKK